MPDFHGLFLGIDRYASPLINELSCAARDARALHALFADTLGADRAVLLRDGEATRAAIQDQFEHRLASVAPDDTVVVTFAGHGSDEGISSPTALPVRTARATRAPLGGCAPSGRCVYTPTVRRTGLLSWRSRA
jgi:helicase